MITTNFMHDNGKISSSRTSSGMFSQTSYVNSNRGGITGKIGNFSYRLNNQGQFIGTGLTVGRHTTYFGRNGSVTNHMTAF